MFSGKTYNHPIMQTLLVVTHKPQRKVGSGRKKGSYSFVKVTIGALKKVTGPKSHIMVSRVWARQNGLVHVPSGPANQLKNWEFTSH